MKRLLREMPLSARAAAARTIAGRIWDVPEISAARIILLYAALPDEVPAALIAVEARRRGIVVTYPRCLPATREMALHEVHGSHQLLLGQYGILEPDATACPMVKMKEIDAALIPGLAWDRTGTRLGRGAGYYDRLLARPDWGAFACGIFLSAQEVPAIPRDRWDVELQAVVTESEVSR